ncbi:hypothetical protein BgAZ_203480 [Babesia gibsoni]|uniref:Uncharacterized protein n=1 Tax=Babesia gibsoni TaxID=33632 RepID=A0AAD8LRV9_BABGI|nr:hypothetical protein BgAZ_203480 [Babesia gibsoni]
MGNTDFVNRIKTQFFGGSTKPEEDPKNLAKFQRILEDERQRKDANILCQFSSDARSAFKFSSAYGECYEKCASQALREELHAASLGSLIPKKIGTVASKDVLTFKKNPNEAALTDLVGEILGDDFSERPKPTAEFLVKQKLNDDIRRNVRVKELQCEVKCAKAFLDLME